MTTDDVWDRLFDELYLRTYAGSEPGDPAEEASAAARVAGVEPPAEVLDAPCGYGRHSLALAEAGYRVTGADRSRVLLGEARRCASGAEWPRWVQADHRELPFADGSFDCALNLFSSLGYRGEDGDRRTLAEFRRVVRPGGSLVIETQHRDRVMSIFKGTDWQELGGGSFRLDARRFDHASGVIETDHILIDADGARHDLTYTMRLYTATELMRLVAEAGFPQVDCFGGWDGQAPSQETRLVIRAA